MKSIKLKATPKRFWKKVPKKKTKNSLKKKLIVFGATIAIGKILFLGTPAKATELKVFQEQHKKELIELLKKKTTKKEKERILDQQAKKMNKRFKWNLKAFKKTLNDTILKSIYEITPKKKETGGVILKTKKGFELIFMRDRSDSALTIITDQAIKTLRECKPKKLFYKILAKKFNEMSKKVPRELEKEISLSDWQYYLDTWIKEHHRMMNRTKKEEKEYYTKPKNLELLLKVIGLRVRDYSYIHPFLTELLSTKLPLFAFFHVHPFIEKGSALERLVGKPKPSEPDLERSKTVPEILFQPIENGIKVYALRKGKTKLIKKWMKTRKQLQKK